MESKNPEPKKPGPKKRKRSSSIIYTENDGDGPGDIPFEASHSGGGQDGAILASTGRNNARNTGLLPPESTSRRISSRAPARKATRNSFPDTYSFSAPVNKGPLKRARDSPVQGSEAEAPLPESTDDGKEDNNVQLSLQLLNRNLWNHIYDEARKCESERRRANNALHDKEVLEEELREVKLRLKKAERIAKSPFRSSGSHMAIEGLDAHRGRKLKDAWAKVVNTCRDSISFSNWDAAGMSEAVNTVQGEIEEMIKPVGSEAPLSPTGSRTINGREQDDHRGDVMRNLGRFLDET
jgi:hypothetical protein